MMQCNSCKAELPKKARICPKCGAQVGKAKGNLKIIAIIGMLIMVVASLLPFAQSTEKLKDGEYNVGYAISFMSIKVPAMWYLFIALLVVGIILVVARKEILSIVASLLAAVVFVVSLMSFQFYTVVGKTEGDGGRAWVYNWDTFSNYLSNGLDYNTKVVNVATHTSTNVANHVDYAIGCGVIIMVIGLIIAIAGVFIDIIKYFKKDLGVDAKYLTNSINQSVWQKIYYHRGFYIMFLPVFIMVLLFNYWPMLGCRYAFTSYVIQNPYYMGLYHFETMFTNDVYFWQAFRNTLILSIIKLILNTGAAVIVSLLLNEIVNILFKKAVQTIVYLPHFMSWVVVFSVFRMILSVNSSGAVNGMLINMGLIKEPISFLFDTHYWRGTFYVMNIWKDTGWGTILFLATLSGISPDLYEAAQIDGANRFQRLIYITLPALANTIITVFILNLAKVMNLFESVFVTASNSVMKVAQVLQTYVYNKTFGASGASNSDYGYSTSVGLFKSFVGMILVLTCNWLSKKVRGRGIV